MALTTVAQYLAPGETNCTAQIYLHHYFANLAFRLKASLSGKEMLRPSDLVELTDFKRVGRGEEEIEDKEIEDRANAFRQEGSCGGRSQPSSV